MPPRQPKPADPIAASFAPLPLSAKARSTLHSALTAMHSKAVADLRPYFERVKLWRDLYEGNVEPVTKPWKDASEIFFPLVKMIADAARSKLDGRIFQQKDVATVESPMQDTDYRNETGEDLQEDLSALRRFINHVALEESELNLRARLDAFFDEQTQVGTAVVRVFHDYRTVGKKKVRLEDGTIEVQGTPDQPFVVSDKIRIKVIPIEQCFWDTTAEDQDELRMFGFNVTYSLAEVRQIAKRQKWSDEDLNRILASPDSSPNEAKRRILQREGVSPAGPPEQVIVDGQAVTISPFATYTLREVMLINQDVDLDGVVEDVIISWHPQSGTIPRVILFPYIHNQMPVILGHYEQRRNRNIGRGVGEPIQSLAAGVNAVGNQTVDAQTIRNCPSIVTPEMSDAALTIETEGWSPGLHLTERVQGEVRTLEFGQSGNTQASFSIFDRLIDMAFRISHLGPSQFGDVSVAQRTPADLGASIMAESDLLIGLIINRNRITISRILHQAVSIYWQVQRGKFTAVLGAEDAAKVARLFNTVGVNRLRVALNVTSPNSSRELDRRNLLALGQFLTGSQRQMLELVNLIVGGQVDPKTGQPIPGNPALAKSGIDVLRSVQTLMRQTVESFPNVTDPEPFVPDLAANLENQTAGAQTVPPGQLGVPPTGGQPAPPGPGAGTLIPP